MIKKKSRLIMPRKSKRPISKRPKFLNKKNGKIIKISKNKKQKNKKKVFLIATTILVLLTVSVYAIIRFRSDQMGLAVLGTTSMTFNCVNGLNADVNNDHTVNSLDPVIILRAAYKKITLTGTAKQNADINKDGVIGVSDAVMAMSIAGKVTCAGVNSLNTTASVPAISAAATGIFTCSRASRADFYTTVSSVDPVDAIVIMQAVGGTRKLTNIQKSSADINNDGKVDANDAVMALRIASKISCVGVDMTNIAKNCVGGEKTYNGTKQGGVTYEKFSLSFYTSLASENNDEDHQNDPVYYYHNNTGISLGFPKLLKDVPVVPFYDFSRIVSNNTWPGGKKIRMLGTDRFNGETFFVLDKGGIGLKPKNRFDIMIPRGYAKANDGNGKYSRDPNGKYYYDPDGDYVREDDTQYFVRVNNMSRITVTGCISN